jgi:hypothetical protein
VNTLKVEAGHPLRIIPELAEARATQDVDIAARKVVHEEVRLLEEKKAKVVKKVSKGESMIQTLINENPTMKSDIDEYIIKKTEHEDAKQKVERIQEEIKPLEGQAKATKQIELEEAIKASNEKSATSNEAKLKLTDFAARIEDLVNAKNNYTKLVATHEVRLTEATIRVETLTEKLKEHERLVAEIEARHQIPLAGSKAIDESLIKSIASIEKSKLEFENKINEKIEEKNKANANATAALEVEREKIKGTTSAEEKRLLADIDEKLKAQKALLEAQQKSAPLKKSPSTPAGVGTGAKMGAAVGVVGMLAGAVAVVYGQGAMHLEGNSCGSFQQAIGTWEAKLFEQITVIEAAQTALRAP